MSFKVAMLSISTSQHVLQTNRDRTEMIKGFGFSVESYTTLQQLRDNVCKCPEQTVVVFIRDQESDTIPTVLADKKVPVIQMQLNRLKAKSHHDSPYIHPDLHLDDSPLALRLAIQKMSQLVLSTTSAAASV